MEHAMANRTGWTRQQLLVAFNLYCQLPFGKLHSRNPDIIAAAQQIDRTPSALAMKLTNIASLDPVITSTGRTGLRGASRADRAMWNEMHADWNSFALESHEAMRHISLDHSAEDAYEQPPTIEELTDYSGEERSTQVRTRVGQNFFARLCSVHTIKSVASPDWRSLHSWLRVILFPGDQMC